jgi:hypothetical protein
VDFDAREGPLDLSDPDRAPDTLEVELVAVHVAVFQQVREDTQDTAIA